MWISLKRENNRSKKKYKDTCTFFGYKHRGDHCPSSGKQWYIWRKFDHFVNQCRRLKGNKQSNHNKVHTVDVEDSEDEDDDFVVDTVRDSNTTEKELWIFLMVINDTIIHMKLDTGADVNILGSKEFQRLKISQSYTKRRLN